MKNKNMLPYENMSKGRSRETTSIYYDTDSNNKGTDTTNTVTVGASCIAFGIIAAPYVPVIYSVGFILGGGAIIALNFF